MMGEVIRGGKLVEGYRRGRGRGLQEREKERERERKRKRKRKNPRNPVRLFRKRKKKHDKQTNIHTK
jgi:hypothetical protein